MFVVRLTKFDIEIKGRVRTYSDFEGVEGNEVLRFLSFHHILTEHIIVARKNIIWKNILFILQTPKMCVNTAKRYLSGTALCFYVHL